MPADRFRKALFTIHLYLATIIGIFVVIFGVTGSIMAFGPEVDALLNHHLYYLTPGRNTLSITELDALVAKQTGDKGLSWAMSSQPNVSWQVFSVDVGTLYVNPYTGVILGTRGDGLSFVEWITELHTRLGLPRQSYVGPAIMNVANALAPLVLISGVYLWWPLKRVTIKGKIRGRRFWFDVHNTIGILCLVFVVALSLTGIFIAYGTDLILPLFASVVDSQPPPLHKTQVVLPDGKPVSADRAIEIARDTLPGAVPDRIFVPPKMPNAAYGVLSHYPGNPNGVGILIDKNTGAVRSRDETGPTSASARVADMNLAIHTGTVFGTPSKVMMSFASLMIAVEAASGFVMWWKRRAHLR